jgi:hypothetical protein
MEPAAAHGFGDRAGNITDAAGEAEPHRERRIDGRPYSTVNGASGTRGGRFIRATALAASTVRSAFPGHQVDGRWVSPASPSWVAPGRSFGRRALTTEGSAPDMSTAGGSA